MTQDEIIKMARESGFITGTKDYADGNGSVKYAVPVGTGGCLVELEKFAQLVAAKEREAIEKLFEELSDNTEPHKDYEDYDDGWVDACYACKLAVTSRGEA